MEIEIDGSTFPVPALDGGWRSVAVDSARPGSRYRYRIDGETAVPDPASRFQPEDIDGPSEVVQPHGFDWTDGDWRGRSWEEAVVYEVHVGTATPEGTFAALEQHLPALRDLGITAIELMPIADFGGTRNWGYDGVLLYAPDSAYGTPDDLKRLVTRAHELGLMVLLDVVYNHFGPAGNYLPVYAGSFFTERHQTPWGAGINFDGEDGRPVRDFVVHNALYWLEEFHLDGLRFDAVHAILDDSPCHIMAEIAQTVRATIPERPIHLILENEHNRSSWLCRDDGGDPTLHTAQWNDDIHHCWHTLLTGESDAYYEDFADRPVERLARCLAEGFAYQGEVSRHSGRTRGESTAGLPPSAFVSFLQNHDQVGNRAFGERLAALAPESRLSLARAGLLLAPQIPMLFMGEEWSASAPFLFFVDFSTDEALSNAVREGRRREFSRFPAFSDPDKAARIPDPTQPRTADQSRLDWSEASREPHASVLADTKRLLTLRRAIVVPLTRTGFIGADQRVEGGALQVVWRYEGGTLAFTANLGSSDATLPRPVGRVLWSSPNLAVGDGLVILPPWTAFASADIPGGLQS